MHLYRERGWVEFSIFPLFSATGLLFEGGANYGEELAFPEAEQLAFERDVLYPLAGLDASKAEEYLRILKLRKDLRYVGVEIAREYLDGEISREEAGKRMMVYSLLTAEKAEQSIAFIEKYRSYKINYSLGEDLVRAYIENHPSVSMDQSKRWELLAGLFKMPVTPSGLKDFHK